MPWISVENSTLMWCIFLNCFSFHFLGFFCTSFLGADCFILYYNLNIHQAIPSGQVYFIHLFCTVLPIFGWLADSDHILQKHNIYKKRLDPTGLILDAPKPDAINQPKVCAL
jgi:hypothetical protein